MAIPIYLGETTRIDDDGNLQTYHTLDADALLERLNAGGSEEQEAAARIKELEAQLAEANARADIWEKNYAIGAPPRYALIKRAEKAEDRITAIDAALDDASAPAATEAKALDDDPIIERVRLWKFAQDSLVDMFEARTTAAMSILADMHDKEDERCRFNGAAGANVGCLACLAQAALSGGDRTT